MPRTKPPYPPELRQRIVDLARAGRTAASLAREFEPTETCIRNWIAQETGATPRRSSPT